MNLAAAQYIIETKRIGAILKQIDLVITTKTSQHWSPRKQKLQRQSWSGTLEYSRGPLCAWVRLYWQQQCTWLNKINPLRLRSWAELSPGCFCLALWGSGRTVSQTRRWGWFLVEKDFFFQTHLNDKMKVHVFSSLKNCYIQFFFNLIFCTHL